MDVKPFRGKAAALWSSGDRATRRREESMKVLTVDVAIL
jgi:hypothetical protein